MAGLRRLVSEVIDEGMASLPTAVAEHLTNSGKELLLAIRALVDEELKWSDIHLARSRELRAKRSRGRVSRDMK